MEPISDTAKVIKNLALRRSWTSGNTNNTILLKKHHNKISPNDKLI